MNKNIFGTHTVAPIADTYNEAGGKAYSLPAKEALAQFASTGTFNNTFYASGQDQMDKVQKLIVQVDSEFLAKLAVYSRKEGYMKDMPAFMVASLAARPDGAEYFDRVFPMVIDNGKMLRNFVQIMRSGVTGRKSLGSKSKRLIKKWFSRDPEWIFKNSIGSEPTLADVIKLAHPHPVSVQHEALFAYLMDKKHNKENLPDLVKHYEAFKKSPYNYAVPNIPFQFLASLNIPESTWKDIARNGGWQMVRMNLNTFIRHNVFDSEYMIDYVADVLKDESKIRGSKVFPYQLLAAYMNVDSGVPIKIKNALQDAMEIATQNVPNFGKNVFVLPDVSGSMSSPVTGHRVGSTSKVECIDVAALVSACILRTTENAEVLPFEVRVRLADLNPRDSVMTNAKKLRSINGGGTNCSAPLEYIIKSGKKVDLIIYVSDDQSWMDGGNNLRYAGHGATSVETLWKQIKKSNRNAKMVCINIAPYDTVQAPDDKDVMNIGGFSDQIFKVIDSFVKGSGNPWIDVINKTEV